MNLTNTDIIVPDNSIQLQIDEKQPQNSHPVNNKKTRHFAVPLDVFENNIKIESSRK
jgi:hypothetical protein